MMRNATAKLRAFSAIYRLVVELAQRIQDRGSYRVYEPD